MIVRVKNGWKVISESTGRNLGTYKGYGSKEKAKRRLKQVEFFKHLKRKSLIK